METSRVQISYLTFLEELHFIILNYTLDYTLHPKLWPLLHFAL